MPDLCRGKLEYHTFDAMWCSEKNDRAEVPNIRNDGTHTHEEISMSESPYARFNQSFNTPLSSETLENVKTKAQDAMQNQEETVQKAQSFVAQNKNALILLGLTVVAFKVEKRMITNIVRKDSLIIKTHLNHVTAGLEDLADMLGARPTEAWASAIADMKR